MRRQEEEGCKFLESKKWTPVINFVWALRVSELASGGLALPTNSILVKFNIFVMKYKKQKKSGISIGKDLLCTMYTQSCRYIIIFEIYRYILN